MSPLAPVLESVVGSTVRPGDRRTAKLVRDWGDPPRHGPLPLQQFASHAVHDNRARRRVSALLRQGNRPRAERPCFVPGSPRLAYPEIL